MRRNASLFVLLVSLYASERNASAQTSLFSVPNLPEAAERSRPTPRAVQNLLSRIQVHRNRAIHGLVGSVAVGPVGFLSDEATALEEIRRASSQFQASVNVLNNELDRILEEDARTLHQLLMTSKPHYSEKDHPDVKAFLSAYKLSFQMMVQNCSEVVQRAAATVERLDGTEATAQQAKVTVQKTLDEFKAHLELNATLFDVSKALLVHQFNLSK